MQACEQMAECLDTLAHQYLATKFVRVPLSPKSSLLPQLGIPQAPGEHCEQLLLGSSVLARCRVPHAHDDLAIGNVQQTACRVVDWQDVLPCTLWLFTGAWAAYSLTLDSLVVQYVT